jgi:hypothetical protein
MHAWIWQQMTLKSTKEMNWNRTKGDSARMVGTECGCEEIGIKRFEMEREGQKSTKFGSHGRISSSQPTLNSI